MVQDHAATGRDAGERNIWSPKAKAGAPNDEPECTRSVTHARLCSLQCLLVSFPQYPYCSRIIRQLWNHRKWAFVRRFGILGPLRSGGCQARQVVSLLVFPSGGRTDAQVFFFSYETQDGLYDLAWSEVHENQLVTASGDGSLKLWDVTLNVSTQLPDSPA